MSDLEFVKILDYYLLIKWICMCLWWCYFLVNGKVIFIIVFSFDVIKLMVFLRWLIVVWDRNRFRLRLFFCDVIKGFFSWFLMVLGMFGLWFWMWKCICCCIILVCNLGLCLLIWVVLFSRFNNVCNRVLFVNICLWKILFVLIFNVCNG